MNTVQLKELCQTFKSDILVNKVEKDTGDYPLFGAKGVVTRLNSYQQSNPYISIIKWGAGVGRAEIRPAYSSIVATMLGIMPNNDVDINWLCYLLQSMHLEQYATNAVIPNLYFKDYCNSFISVPNFDEQVRIAYILDKVQRIVDIRKQQLSILDDLIKSRFLEMFCNSNEWEYVHIKDICTDMRTGPFGSALHHDEFVDEGIFVLGIDNAVDNEFSYNRMRYITEEKYQQLKRYTVKPLDVIITIMGTVGRSAVIPKDIPLAINTKHLACLTLNKDLADSSFVAKAIQIHPELLSQLSLNSKGAIMDGLNLTIIKGLKFRLPPLALQQQFAAFVEQTDKSKSAVKKLLEKAETLKKALMQEYFG